MNNNKQHLIKSIVLNSCIIVFAIVALIMILCKIRLFGDEGNLTPEGTIPFSMFTVDSNLLLALFTIPILVYQILILMNKRKEIPFYAYVLKYIGVVGTSLTMLTVFFYLAPILGSKFYRLFLEHNFFYHLIVPALGIVSFIFLEYDHYEPIKFRFTFLGIVPMLVYATYYVINAFTHMDADGNVPWKYDVYAFVSKGIGIGIVMIFVMIGFVYLISFLLYLSNKLMWKKYFKEQENEKHQTL